MTFLTPRRKDLVLIAIAVSFLTAHLPFLASTPGTIDSVNFSLGIRDFDVGDHRPHPPGYPVYIALGKASRAVLNGVSVGDSARDEVRALAIWSALFGALGTFVLFQFFRGLEKDDRLATAGAALAVTCPLFWFNAVRPMSDIPGLVAGLSAQALLVTAFRRYRERETRLSNDARQPAHQPMLVLGALVAGVAIGFRTQTAWLTVPLLIWVVACCRPRLKSTAYVATAFVIGLLLWAIPLVLASEGPVRYVGALKAMGHDDLARADILATHPTLQRLALGLIHTFAYPWASTTLAAAMIGLSLLGAGTMLVRSRSSAFLLAVAIVPYSLFHLIFQESLHTRYALPLMPAVAYLAVRGVQTLSARGMPWLVAGLSVVSVLIAFPPVAAYSRTGSPAYQALDDLRAQASRETVPRVLAMHYAVARMLRGQPVPLRTLPSTPKHEWLALVKHWQSAPDTPVWFLAEAGRTDLALIDPRSRRLVRSYRWSFRRKFLMARMPMRGLDWYEMNPPGWMAGEGWSLNLDSGGIAFQDRQGPSHRPIVAFVRRRSEPAVLMVGGRNLSGSTGPTARLDLSVGGRSIDSWSVGSARGSFLRMWKLPAGTLAGPERYLPLQVRATPVDGPARALRVAIHQFDLQPVDSIVYGFDSGWYEQEYDDATPWPWRWSGPSGILRVHHAGHDLTLRVVGELPLKHLAGEPSISVRAGEQLLARFLPNQADVDFEVQVPGSALDASGGYLAIETTPTFVPDRVMGNNDQRQLGLRTYHIELRQAQATP